MAQQNGGWPLGLQPLSLRVGMTRDLSSSFSTVITGSPRASSATSSDFDAESAGSFFHDRSITLGNLIGFSNFLELSFRSLGKSRRQEEASKGNYKSHRAKTWFSLCLGAHPVEETTSNAPSLGHYLEVERRASTLHRTEGRSTPVANTLFSDGFVVPSQMNGDRSLVMAGDVKESSTWVGSDDKRRCHEDSSHANGFLSSLLLPCMGWRSGY